jgi:hypothetical protein
MAERVTCIVRGDKDRYSVCRCITEIRTDARKYTRLEAHEKVKTSLGSIYGEAGDSRADLIPAVRDGLKYVRTAPNDTTTDNRFTSSASASTRRRGAIFLPATSRRQLVPSIRFSARFFPASESLLFHITFSAQSSSS